MLAGTKPAAWHVAPTNTRWRCSSALDDPGVAGVARRAAEATEDLLERRDTWLPRVAEIAAEGSATFTIAPAERLSSAEQGALMLREGPRRTADACEAGDWLHVDVYLTKPLDYRALLFAGSRFEPAIMEWMRQRGGRVVAVGGEVEGAADVVRYRHDDETDVALLTEVLVPELLAVTWWKGPDGSRFDDDGRAELQQGE